MFLFCFVCYVTKIDVDETDKRDNSLFVTVSSQTSNCHLTCFKVNKLFKNTSMTILFVMKSARNCRNLSLTPSSPCCKILNNIIFLGRFSIGAEQSPLKITTFILKSRAKGVRYLAVFFTII